MTFLVAAALGLSACGVEPNNGTGAGKPPEKSPSAPPEKRDEPLEPGGLKAPPPVTINFSDQSLDLEAWTYCFETGCADGSPPKNPPDVGSPNEVVVDYPLDGWTFTASFIPAGEKCGRDQQVPLEPTGDGSFLLKPAGRADTYDVTLFGRGQGDLFVTFRWTTPNDGPLPEPEARAAILADHDGRVDSYGIEVQLTNLAETPEEAAATITVEAENGDSITFDAKRAGGGCWPEGTVYWDGPDDKGLQAAQLGGGPFKYIVELTLDGRKYVGTATWPDDEIEGNEPSAALEFTPDLPAVR